jgi:hypothetical protein
MKTVGTFVTLAIVAAVSLTFGVGTTAFASSTPPSLASGSYTTLPAGSSYAKANDKTHHGLSGGTVIVPGSVSEPPPVLVAGAYTLPPGSSYAKAGDRTLHVLTDGGTLFLSGATSAAPSPSGVTTPTLSPTTTGTPAVSPPKAACSPGKFPVAYFGPDFKGPISRTFSDQFIAAEGSYIETCYPAASRAPSSGHPGGAQAKLAITAGPKQSYTLSYQLRFPVGFTWIKGGKLPGLCGGACWTGSHNGPGGWSARFMWRSNGAAEVLLSDATTTGDGTDLGRGTWDWIADGKFHTLTERLTMNTGGHANGTIIVDYAGVQVANFTGITFNTAAEPEPEPIDSLMFTTFFGGNDSSWAPTTLQHIDFSDFSAI